MKLIHHGHSCVELCVGDVTLLFDPGTFSDVSDVEGVDAIVVTHQHPDHLDPEAVPALRQRNPDAVWFAEPETVKQLADLGIEATATAAGERYDVKGVALEGVGATHAEIHPYIPRVGNVGIVVDAEGEPRVFHPGDSLEGRPEDVDYLLVPLAAPWSAVKETIAFVRAVSPKHVVPIHDEIIAPKARGVFLGHVKDHGLDGGIDVVDPARGESVDLKR